VLSTPPAFVLSQDQTLQTKTNPHPQKAQAEFNQNNLNPTKRHQKTGITKKQTTPSTREVSGMAKKQQQKQNHQTHY
jgi:hypothetical protein